MTPPPGQLRSGVKLPVQARMFPEEIATVDAFAAELSQQSYGAAFSRAEALRIAAMEWLKERQARRVRVTTAPPSSAPAAARVVTEAVTTVPAPSPPAVPAASASYARGRSGGRGCRHGGHALASKAPRACPCRPLTTYSESTPCIMKALPH